METPEWFDESKFVPTPADRLPAADMDDLFEQACTNSGYLPAFQRRLPDSNLGILVRDVPESEDAIGQFVPVAPLTIGDGQIPVFTSLARALEGGPDGKLPPGVSLIWVRMRELLEQLRDRDVVLNPFSENTMTLGAAGIAAILAGSFEVDGLSQHTLQMPSSYETTIDIQHTTSDDLLEALRVLLSQHPRVRAGYLIYLQPDGRQPVSRYHLRLDVEGGEIKQLMNEIAPVIKPFIKAGEGFEMLAGLTDDEASDYLRQQGPFYERT